MDTNQSWSAWGRRGGLGALVALTGAIALTTGVGFADESWFLRVLQRVNAGELLYRDVYYPLLPLPIYIGAAVTALFGSTFLVLQVLFFAIFVAIVWTCHSLSKALNIGVKARALLFIALCMWSSPAAVLHVMSAYQPLAALFRLLTLRLVVAWSDRDPGLHADMAIAGAGVAAAAAFAAHDQVGIAALAGVLLSVAARAFDQNDPIDRLWRTCGVVVGAFIVCVLLILTPVVVSGGLNQLIEGFVVEREAYIRTGYVSYLGNLRPFIEHARHMARLTDVFEIVRDSVFLVLPAVLVTLTFAVALMRGERRRHLVILWIFAVGAFLTAFPRSDIPHVIFTSPLLLVALAYSIDRLQERRWLKWTASGLLGAWLLIGLGAGIVESLRRARSDDYGWLHLPHFERAMLPRAEIDRLHRHRDALVAAAGQRPIFLLTDHAAFYYLVSGVENPTPIDYSLATAMGRDGERRLMRLIRARQIPVCMQSYPNRLLRPEKFERFVRTKMHLAANLGFCQLYRWDSRGVPGS